MGLIDLVGSKRLGERLAFVLLAAMVSLCGCGQTPYPVAPVRGKVTIDGKPLSGGRIVFAPIAQSDSIDSGKWAVGTIQSDGSFELSTYGANDGAVVGEHWATIIASKNAAFASTPKFSRVKVPRKIAVEAGTENDIPIALTSQEIARYGRKPK